MIFYAYDLENYKNNLRDFYFDMINEVPGPICLTNDEMIGFIKNYTEESYKMEFGEKYKNWSEKFNTFDDGNASKKVIDLIRNG